MGVPPLPVDLSPCILVWAAAKRSGDPSHAARLCAILIFPFGAGGGSWGALAQQQKNAAPGHGLLVMSEQGCSGDASCRGWVNETPQTPRGIWPGGSVSAAGEEQAAGNTEMQPPPPPLQPFRNALIGLMKAKHTTCNIYKWLIRQRNCSAGLKTLGT